MRYAPLFLLLLLSACTRPTDTQPPLIGITQPKSGVIPQRSFQVQGYVLDDSGVQSIRASGKEVLPEASRGQKLVRFSFRVQAPQSGQVEVKVEATDVHGQTRTVRLPLVLDARPPQIVVERVERLVTVVQPAQRRTLPDGTEQEIPARTTSVLQVSGRVLDDTGVDRVTLQYNNRYNPLSLPKGKEVNFYVELPVRQVTIIAVDAAGNRASRVVAR
ncbi:MAG: hypothetical protein NZ849_03125 [Meiothermus sp.]|uniref:hypothetical protein n=1 Tax=Meiothermus sp. TaxID=1955249 RepID=UPI0025F1EAC9|nr:hypothetical protein [Meiothermus sp.]MCS7058634.1 hypothetical protein [Meiothermus sp.]MCS7193894.1 hypothetical protein [Meiothermus sp.]MCX7739890.1 hypothetical protein [Meiothermus sp.]MDW8090160.1 hypothetical protein [Meiothermus sp.]MDW8481462.1 hypothetical protein [Meiothermus sp.]